MEADGTAEHFNGSLQQNHRNGTVDVVIAIEEDGLAVGDGAFHARHGSIHAKHEEWIVKVSELGIQEDERFNGGGNAARDQKLCEHLR
jgi:hypothetical protein